MQTVKKLSPLMSLFPVLLITGCVSTLPTSTDKDYQHVEMHGEWQACRNVYKRAGAFWVSRFRSTRAIELGLTMPPMDVMHRDMIDNKCHALLARIGYQ